MRAGEEEHTAHQSLLTTVLTHDMSRVTPGELEPGSSAGPGQEEGNQWLAGYGCVVPGEDRRGGVNWTKQPIILTVELRWLGRAAWADTGIIFAAGSSPAQLPGTGGGGTAPWHRARSIYPHKDDTIRHKNTASQCAPAHFWTRIQTKLRHE